MSSCVILKGMCFININKLGDLFWFLFNVGSLCGKGKDAFIDQPCGTGRIQTVTCTEPSRHPCSTDACTSYMEAFLLTSVFSITPLVGISHTLAPGPSWRKGSDHQLWWSQGAERGAATIFELNSSAFLNILSTWRQRSIHVEPQDRASKKGESPHSDDAKNSEALLEERFCQLQDWQQKQQL